MNFERIKTIGQGFIETDSGNGWSPKGARLGDIVEKTEKGYRLLSTDELVAHLDEYKHLLHPNFQ